MHRTHNPTVSAADTDNPAVVVTPADTLRGAATYVERHGLHQASYYAGPDEPTHDADYQPFPPACVVGAIAMAAYGRRYESVYFSPDDPEGLCALNRAVDAFIDYLAIHEPVHRPDDGVDLDDDMTPFVWNDQPRRTAQQVYSALRAAADDYDRTHGGTR